MAIVERAGAASAALVTDTRPRPPGVGDISMLRHLKFHSVNNKA